MNRLVHRLFLCTTICLLSSVLTFLSAQTVSLPLGQYNFTQLVNAIEAQTDYILSYSPDKINVEESVNLSSINYELKVLLKRISRFYKLSNEIQEANKRIILISNISWTISGYVKDGLSDESLLGVNIIVNQGANTITNEDGFFSLTENFRDKFIYFSYVGYRTDSVLIRNYCVDVFEIKMMPENIIQGVLILDTTEVLFNQDPIKHNRKEIINASLGVGGSPDLFNYIRHLPGVSVGSEGQNGLLVRGGGPEQNLILLDGLPIYEASHLGGLSSIFIPDAIKNIDFYKSGFPARFGGKLSSVLDIRLKEGHRKEFKRSLNMGLEGIQGHIEGPLGEKTSININGKLSWFSLLTSPIIRENLDFNDSSLNYSDAYAKITHWFSPSNRVSLSFYKGNDLIRLTRDQNDQSQNFQIMDFNRIEWGNTLLSFNWNRTLSDKVFSNTVIGISSFNYSSRGSYDINYTNIDSTESSSFDIFSNSNLKDYSISQSIDYYTSNAGKFKFGITFIRHKNAPSIIESEEFLDSTLHGSAALDSTYYSNEVYFFAENRIILNNNLEIHSGVRLNHFSGLDKNYFYLQPRIDLNYKFGHQILGLSYARMSQFIHLLVNPGPGLPSDLWVPSTSQVEPEISDVFALKYKFQNKHFLFSLSPYYNRYSNIIDYSNVSDILYSLIIDNKLFNVTVDNTNWEKRISIGKGESYGIEFQTVVENDVLLFDASYTLSRSTRQFADLNRGNKFPYKYDRRHNISTRVIFKISSNKSLQVNWVYGTGNAFTLATEEIKGPDCFPRLVPISRNNGRVPDFHHMDIVYSVQKTLKNEAHIKYSFGIYNVYNRLNPFYVYLFQNPETLDFEGFRKISIYPIIPQVNIEYKW